jgi:hypothetical protein
VYITQSALPHLPVLSGELENPIAFMGCQMIQVDIPAPKFTIDVPSFRQGGWILRQGILLGISA